MALKRKLVVIITLLSMVLHIVGCAGQDSAAQKSAVETSMSEVTSVAKEETETEKITIEEKSDFIELSTHSYQNYLIRIVYSPDDGYMFGSIESSDGKKGAFPLITTDGHYQKYSPEENGENEKLEILMNNDKLILLKDSLTNQHYCLSGSDLSFIPMEPGFYVHN